MMPLPGTGGNVYEPTMTTGDRTVPTPALLSGSGSPSRNLRRICCGLKAFQMRFLHYTICDMWDNFSDKTFDITNKITCFEPINWFIVSSHFISYRFYFYKLYLQNVLIVNQYQFKVFVDFIFQSKSGKLIHNVYISSLALPSLKTNSQHKWQCRRHKLLSHSNRKCKEKGTNFKEPGSTRVDFYSGLFCRLCQPRVSHTLRWLALFSASQPSAQLISLLWLFFIIASEVREQQAAASWSYYVHFPYVSYNNNDQIIKKKSRRECWWHCRLYSVANILVYLHPCYCGCCWCLDEYLLFFCSWKMFAGRFYDSFRDRQLLPSK